MKVKEIPINTVFNIEHTPSYPKIKIEGGYIDIRDKIINKNGNCDELEAEVMPLELLAENYEGTIEEVKSWIKVQTGIAV